MKRKCYPNFTENRGTLWTRLLSSPARSRTKPGCNWVIWCWLVLQHGAHQPLSSPLQMAGIGHSVSGSGLWENPITHSHRTHGIKILSNYFSRIIRIKKQKTNKKNEERKTQVYPTSQLSQRAALSWGDVLLAPLCSRPYWPQNDILHFLSPLVSDSPSDAQLVAAQGCPTSAKQDVLSKLGITIQTPTKLHQLIPTDSSYS